MRWRVVACGNRRGFQVRHRTAPDDASWRWIQRSSRMSSREGVVSRRVFIQVAFGTGAGLLISACSRPAPSAPAAAPTSSPKTSVTSAAAAGTPATATEVPTVIGAATSGKNSQALPNYISPNLLAKPDYDAHDPRVTL